MAHLPPVGGSAAAAVRPCRLGSAAGNVRTVWRRQTLRLRHFVDDRPGTIAEQILRKRESPPGPGRSVLWSPGRLRGEDRSGRTVRRKAGCRRSDRGPSRRPAEKKGDSAWTGGPGRVAAAASHAPRSTFRATEPGAGGVLLDRRSLPPSPPVFAIAERIASHRATTPPRKNLHRARRPRRRQAA